MMVPFLVLSAVAVVSTAMVITRSNAIHALLYLIVSLLAVASIFFILGAHFAAALEVVIYAGAIIVLFIFVVMMLNMGPESVQNERRWLGIRAWIGPSALLGVLAAELFWVLGRGGGGAAGAAVDARRVGAALYGPYLLGVEATSFLLLAGLIGAYHIGRRKRV